ncbi:tyrosine-type recombinase/integrase [Fictibacillus phosphorivorans]|uniref:tyrosine-type recombinase/integrase n=1 Tax=Fictibacillus phosphorivorans TaxID=1221500 RepID=UPI0020413D80|nr:tyrosine-type recombinase/integrase [Fictibacillus phosphorivorans]MCM3717073.1 phage integrase N-terminal SAM-like domain-containing protein [Fictibacillus phosphorivorans]MCM3774760.1 phage integrase N-terminal SAM-like domain-containing protein [Fictibacillus phosphorivorans]
MEEYPHLPEYAKSFINHLQNKGRKKSTIKRYYYDLQDFFAWLRVVKDSDNISVILHVTSEHLKEYFLFLSEQRQYSKATSKRVFTVIKGFFQYLQSQKLIQGNPFIGIEKDLEEDNQFLEDDFITEEEFQKLFKTLSSFDGLTEKQQKYRHLLIKRNEAIISLLYHYGLTLQELTNIKMKHVNFIGQHLTVTNGTDTRQLPLTNFTQQLLYTYKEDIPASIRPNYYSSDRFFIAFDYQRGTFRFDYSTYEPKPLTVIAIQKMLRQEIRRSGLRPGLSAQHLRRTAILNFLASDKSAEEAQAWFGLKSILTLQRYDNYLEQIKNSLKP